MAMQLLFVPLFVALLWAALGLLQARVDGDSAVTQLPPQTVHLGLETLHVGTVY